VSQRHFLLPTPLLDATPTTGEKARLAFPIRTALSGQRVDVTYESVEA
jgi:hypothetical protein